MISLQNATLQQLILLETHNRDNTEKLEFSEHNISKEFLSDHEHLFIERLLSSFSKDEYFNMQSDHQQHSCILDIQKLFANHPADKGLSALSKKFAAQLSPEPVRLIAAFIDNILIGDELTNAIVIVIPDQSDYVMVNPNKWALSKGFLMRKVIIGAVILNIYAEDGYRILLKNHIQKSAAYHLLKNEFLNVQPVQDNFHQTKSYLQMCNSFIKEQLPEDASFQKIDQVDVMNKSIQYFKNEDTFDENAFVASVFDKDETANAFKYYKQNYATQHQTELNDNFEISLPAVKKSNKVFKSVIKLDRNFHIYVHGDKALINKGVESTGRKYYKIYFDEEY